MRSQRVNFSHDNNRVIYNFSRYNCSKYNFSLCHAINNSDLSSSQSKAMKSNILDTVFSSPDRFNKFKIKSNLFNQEMKTLHYLHKEKQLDIQNADKGNAVALTEKNSYANSMNEKILHENKFEHINTEEDKQFNFILKSKKKVVDLTKHSTNEG